ncbi:unnamed protein product [Symbiodinium sp. CCMP2456]|nr:unnamed protein product [Symbiodinium sp. CCMP2456]
MLFECCRRGLRDHRMTLSFLAPRLKAATLSGEAADAERRIDDCDGSKQAAADKEKAVECEPCKYLLRRFSCDFRKSELRRRDGMANTAENFHKPQFPVPPCAARAQWVRELVATPVSLQAVSLAAPGGFSPLRPSYLPTTKHRSGGTCNLIISQV